MYSTAPCRTNLNMEAECSSETSVTIYETTPRHISLVYVCMPGDNSKLIQHLRQTAKAPKIFLMKTVHYEYVLSSGT
jgi:hypothetical protein